MSVEFFIEPKVVPPFYFYYLSSNVYYERTDSSKGEIFVQALYLPSGVDVIYLASLSFFRFPLRALGNSLPEFHLEL